MHWTKPNLGLVEYRGNRNNNLVLMEPRLGTVNVKVLFDPDDPNPDRRYKMVAHVWFPKNDVRLGTLAPYASKDGLRWKLLLDAEPVDAELRQEDMVLPALHFEPAGGLYKWDGLYYLSGQSDFITATVDVKGDGPHRFYMNADGLGDEAMLKVELLSHNAVSLPEFSGETAAMLRESGFQAPIMWNGNDCISGLPERVRLRVTFAGRKNTDIRFSAIYVR